jgi:1-deoxy-D-xylulose-5-phosphate reductoisomerase
MKRVVILGSTGSIGRQTLEVIADQPNILKVVGLAAGGGNVSLLKEQAAQFGVSRIATYRPIDGLASGMEAIIDLATLPEADIVVVCVAGVIGLLPTVRAIEAGKHIALASKEVLVAAGEWVMPLARRHRVLITPIDSEHSALFQCLQGYRSDQIEKLILTASGGPFRGRKRDELASVTVEQALNHPTWSMGGKITVDSATLMNKGLETIEARWLFDVPVDRVEAVIHPQSIVHSFVKFHDGSVLGQLGWPSMKLPILYALLYPERAPNSLRQWEPVLTPNLTFQPVDHEAFPCIGIAVESARRGGTTPCAMNAANEYAVNAFLENRIRFLHIPEIVEQIATASWPKEVTLESLVAVDQEARVKAAEIANSVERP